MDTLKTVLADLETIKKFSAVPNQPNLYETNAAYATDETFGDSDDETREGVYKMVLDLSQGDLQVVDDWEIADVIRQMLEDGRIKKESVRDYDKDDRADCEVLLDIQAAVRTDMIENRL